MGARSPVERTDRELRDACVADPVPCAWCDGAGVDRGEAYRPCPRCDGYGEVSATDGREWREFPQVGAR